jgi:anti-sigma factor ChrR (cupin superfamily)
VIEMKGPSLPAAALWLALLGAGAPATAEQTLLMKGHDAVAAPQLEWVEAKSIPPGARMILLHGSPDQPGPYIFRVKFPAGYKLPPHHHQDVRSVTVLKGNYWSAVGDTYDQAKLKKFGPRDYYTTDAGVNHFAWAETEVIIQEMGIGPVSSPIEYANPADDPRK